MNIYLDIETIPGQAEGLKAHIAETISPPGTMKKAETIAKWESEQKPAAIEDAWRKTAVHGDQGEIVCVAWAIDDGPVKSLSRAMNIDHGEQMVLIDFFDVIHQEIQRQNGRVPTWVGHNVRDFDLRFLFHRAVINDVRPPFKLPHDVSPSSERVYDTMSAWAGYRDRISLDRLCRALDIPLKGSELDGEAIDGSRVWDFVEAGRIDDVAAYCRADVERVRAVYRRLMFVREAPAAMAV